MHRNICRCTGELGVCSCSSGNQQRDEVVNAVDAVVNVFNAINKLHIIAKIVATQLQ